MVAEDEDEGEGWDFFVSYTQTDRAWAEWIAWQLEEAGHRVLLQAWDFVPGTNWIKSMHEGVAKADRTIAVLSETYLKSVYGGAEWQLAWAADPTGQDRRLLVVRVSDCDRPGLLAGVVGVDLFGSGEVQTRVRLQQMIADAVSGRRKPETAPVFPLAQRSISHGARFPGALPRVWNVPARNPNFTGRAEGLSVLAKGFAANRMVTVHSLHGMGGVGKSQLATEYAHTHAENYDAVWWLTAEEPTLLPEQLARLAMALGVEPRSGDAESVRSAAHQALRDAGGWLLVFDNAESTDVVRYWLPTAPQAPGTPGHALVTTRREGFDALGQQVDLDVMELRESVQLLRTRTPALEEQVAEQIATELDRLPLALEQAAAYLNKTGIAPLDYLRLLRTRTHEVIQRGRVDGRDVTIATLWDLSFERLTAHVPAAVQLLDLCAYLAPVSIPLSLFTAHPDLLPVPLAGSTRDALQFTDVIEAVVDYSLVKRTPDGLLLHRLVQAAIRARHLTGRDAAVLALLRASVPEGPFGGPQDWSRWAGLLPHVLTVAARVVDEPELGQERSANGVGIRHCAWLLDRAGTYLRAQGRYRDALPLTRRALNLDEEALGPDHPDVATHLGNLALIMRALGQPEAARPLAERASSIVEAALGPEHPDVATQLNTLTLILRDLGEPGAARPLIARALRITEAALGPDHPEVASRLSNYAAVLRALGEPAAARPLAERALTIAEASLGSDHPAVATRLTTFALVLRDLGEAAAARPLAERALMIHESAMRPDHPDVATSLSNLAIVLRDLGEAGAARPLAERALSITEVALGPDHPAVAVRLLNLAVILQDLGEVGAAQSLAQQAELIRGRADSSPMPLDSERD